MPSLRDTQTALAAALFGAAEAEAAGLLRGGALSPRRRLEIYRNNVLSTLRGALRDSYPVVHRLLGNAFFDHVATGFVQARPSLSGDLHEFGAEFADFLAAFPACADYPYLADVARLEWMCDRVFHAADHPRLETAALAAIPEEAYAELRFRLHPASGLLASPYPVLRIWQVNQEGYQGEPAVDLGEGGVNVLVTRRDFVLQLEGLADGEFQLLAHLGQGAPLGRAADAANHVEPEFDLGATLARHVLEGVIVGFDAAIPAESRSTR